MKYETVFDGVYHFQNTITDSEKQAILDLYEQSKHETYAPVLKSGHSMNLDMTCFGKHWSAVDYKYHDSRVDYDREPVKPVPSFLNDIAKRHNEIVFPEHEPIWDIGLMNFYRGKSTLGLHKDDSESRETLKSGHPVVSFSLGASCIFRIGGLFRNDETQDIILADKDVLIFGGRSRLRYHGVVKVLKTENQKDERINITLRKY